MSSTGKMLGLAVLFVACAGFVSSWTDAIYWGFNGLTRAKEWVSPDGRMSSQATLPNMSTAIELWPTSGTPRPAEHSIGELTINRCMWSDPCMERINVSAMVDQTDGGAYRIGVERGGTGQFRPILFCFEDVTPGVAACPFKIDHTGVYVLVNGAYRPVAYQ